MALTAPLPRFHIYTTPETYWRGARNTVLQRTQHGAHDVEALERAVASLTSVPHAVCMPQARVGIYMALTHLIEPGQKVILSPHTISEVVNMVICAGGRPVFCDIERRTCNIDLSAAADLIDDDTGAVLVTHLHGLGLELEEFRATCRARGVVLIEDAAQAFGTRVQGQSVGTFGDAGVFSFGMYKSLTSFVGGMVVTKDGDLARRLHQSTSNLAPQEASVQLKKVAHGLATDVVTYPPLFKLITFPIFRLAFLLNIELLNKHVRFDHDPVQRQEIPPEHLRRLTPLQARLCPLGLDRVDTDIRKHVAFAHRYDDGLSDIEELTRPPRRDDGSHTYTYYPVQFERRGELLKHLTRRGCDIGAQHLRNCADLTCFKEHYRDCPQARATADDTLLLPTYPRYQDADVARNTSAIREFFGKGHA